MATWQLGGLPSMAPQNDNAPRSSVPQPVQYQQQPNVGLMALQGLRGVAEINQQARQQQRKAEFQKAYAGAFESGDRNKMRSLISEYPEEFESVQKGMGFIDDDQRNSIGHLATSAQIASSLGTGAFGKFIADNEDEMRRLGISPESVAEMHVNDPQGFQRLAGSMALFSLGHEKYFDIKDQMEGRDIERDKLAETIRSNQAGEALTARGQNITMRGQDLAMQRTSMKGAVGNNERTVQLADGRTVTVGGKLHGAGANAFYEGIDNEGNMVRVPAGSIAAPATSAANAQNYEMKKDLEAISGASIDDIGFMTGITGSSGSFALGADIRSRASGAEERRLYNAAQRILGKMQNQGIAAARDMGASGINTEAEANRYFQGMPKPDFSSPEALQQSMRDIQQYTDNYNQQYNVNVGNGGKKSSRQQPATQQSAGGSYTSKSGIQFTVE
ncbi:DNA transfer protein [Escherichia coli]|uniref:DNA transfer protein n=1 Tax=Salmonella typhimurium TaxID=90371 RepID=A0A734H974_SALTM|nr:phage DNA ejection protein [Escherichia coli]HAE6272443.1 DNA transfer protein [Salmonella enterica subsp. enterica serovar Typhimurium]EEQ2977140.1 DNA transfer protein [Escherichia coli]EET6447942.1 DNA transfer protein [Escherichia coli]EET6498609.1 DNA transfer protein [Escherichia coli]EET6762328.1 DNA transfer protein [Escherichia coli]